jgi:hypothetical protein
MGAQCGRSVREIVIDAALLRIRPQRGRRGGPL